MGETVKKQHYIWRNYLSDWTDTGDRFKGKIYVMRKELKGNQKKIEFRELEKIGFENYYYDITNFKQTDIDILSQLIDYIQKNEVIKVGIAFEALNNASIQRDYIEKNIMCNYENIETENNFFEKIKNYDLSFYQDSNNQIILDKLKKNVLDSIMYNEETTVEEILKLVKDFSVDNAKDTKYDFNCFFWMQYLRTPRVHNDVKKNIEELKHSYKVIKDLDEKFLSNMLMIFMSNRLAMNITKNFSSSILLFKNNTDVPFITGDTPIINLSRDENSEINIFHYPLSPKIAIQLIIVPKNSSMATVNKNMIMELDKEFACLINSLNKRIAENCVNEIYSNSEISLSNIKSNL